MVLMVIPIFKNFRLISNKSITSLMQTIKQSQEDNFIIETIEELGSTMYPYILTERAGVGLDKKVVEQLLDIVAPYPVGVEIKTSDEGQGIVIAQTTDKNSPIIMMIDEKEKKYQKKNLMLEKDIFIAAIM